MRNRKKVQGGWINDSDTNVTMTEKVGDRYIEIWRCPIYEKWKSIRARCSPRHISRRLTYARVSCDEDWKIFSKFKSWMLEYTGKIGVDHYSNEFRALCLDKDMINPEAKRYSPENCCLVTSSTNNFFVKSDKSRNRLPIGVCENTAYGNYTAQCRSYAVYCGSGSKFLGNFSDVMLAHAAWQSAKIEAGKVLATLQIDPRARDAILRAVSDIEEHRLAGAVTINY